MKILDARGGIVGDETLQPIRKVHGRAPNSLAVYKLRDQPEAALLQKRMSKHRGADQAITPFANPKSPNSILHARLRDMDEASGKVMAVLDRAGGMTDYRATKKSLKNLPVHFHSMSADKLRRGKPVGDLDYDYDDARQQVHLMATVHDEDEAKKIGEGLYSHLRIEHDAFGQPVHVSLTDSTQSEASKFLKLTKRDRSVSMVAVKNPSTCALSPLTKRDGSLDPFRQIHRAGPRRGF